MPICARAGRAPPHWRASSPAKLRADAHVLATARLEIPLVPDLRVGRVYTGGGPAPSPRGQCIFISNKTVSCARIFPGHEFCNWSTTSFNALVKLGFDVHHGLCLVDSLGVRCRRLRGHASHRPGSHRAKGETGAFCLRVASGPDPLSCDTGSAFRRMPSLLRRHRLFPISTAHRLVIEAGTRPWPGPCDDSASFEENAP